MADLIEHKGFIGPITIRVVGKWDKILSADEESASEDFEVKPGEECFYSVQVSGVETYVSVFEAIPLPDAGVGIVLEHKSYNQRVRVRAYNRTQTRVHLRVTVLGVTRS